MQALHDGGVHIEAVFVHSRQVWYADGIHIGAVDVLWSQDRLEVEVFPRWRWSELILYVDALLVQCCGSFSAKRLVQHQYVASAAQHLAPHQPAASSIALLPVPSVVFPAAHLPSIGLPLENSNRGVSISLPASVVPLAQTFQKLRHSALVPVPGQSRWSAQSHHLQLNDSGLLRL